jgi:hypothetical protein
MSKYQPLSARLSAHPDPEWRADFAELERLLGFPLPKAARTGRSWWKPEGGAHARAWTDIGWSAHEVDPSGGLVIFRREGASSAKPPGAAAKAPQPPEAAPLALGDEPAIVKSLERPKWHMAVLAGGLALLAGGAALAIRSVVRRRGEAD